MNYNSTGNFKAKWFDEECFQLKREVKRILRRYRRKGKLCDFQSYLKIRKKDYKSKVKTKKRLFKQRQIDSLLGSAGNPKDFWGEIRKCKRKMITHSIDDDE